MRIAMLAVLVPALSACSSSSGAPATDGGVAGDGATLDSAVPGDDSGDAGGTDAGHVGDAAPPDDFAWVDSFQAGFGSTVLAIASDGASVVIAGQITGTATFGTTTLTAPGSVGNAFVAKLDASGNVVWAQIVSGAASDFEAIAIDPSGNVIVAGTDFGTGPSVTLGGTTLAPTPSDTIGGKSVSESAGFLVELDPTGAVTWAKLVESTGEVNLGSIALSGGTIFAAGPIIDDAAFGNGGTMAVTGCGTAGCVYLAAWAGDGTIQWAKNAPSTPHRGTGADPREVWLAANSTHLVLAIGGDQEAAAGGTDAAQVVVNEYDLTGALTWSRPTPLPNGGPAVTGVALDPAGNAYVSGDFGTGLVLGSLTVAGGEYVAKYSSTGDVAWAIDDPQGSVLGIHGLALGTTLYTFGNGDVGPEPDGGTSMSLDGLDPATGKMVSVDPCSATMGIGQVVAASTAGVFVAGQGGPPGQFGRYSVSKPGLFVAKKR